jgi:hypothetical protein
VQPRNKEIAPFSSKNKMPKRIAKAVLRRNSKIEEVKQQATLIAQKMNKITTGGLERPANVRSDSKRTEGKSASGSASEEYFFRSFGSPGFGSGFMRAFNQTAL